MSLLERLNDDMKEAMKSKDKEKLSVIRMVKATIQNELINLKKTELSTEEELTVLSRELKQRKDSLHEFANAGRQDLVDKIQAEIAIVELYAPKQLSEQELEEIIRGVIADVQATSKADMGKVMGAVIPRVKGQADGNLVKKIVQQLLS